VLAQTIGPSDYSERAHFWGLTVRRCWVSVDVWGYLGNYGAPGHFQNQVVWKGVVGHKL
jgi:hypothetical protein